MENESIIFKNLDGEPVDIIETIKNKKLRAVFWDLGGTLVDMRGPLKAKILQKINTTCKVQIDQETYDQTVKDEWECRENRQELDRIKGINDHQKEKEYWFEFYACILEKLKVQGRYTELLKWLAKVQANHRSFEAIAGIDQVLRELATLRKKGIKTGVISNAFPSAKEIIMHSNLKSEFDYIILSYEYNSVKPESRIYSKAVRKAWVKPEEVLFIDDRRSFVLGAARFGMQAVLIEKSNGEFRRESNTSEDISQQTDQAKQEADSIFNTSPRWQPFHSLVSRLG